jgi:hypothetical protein
VSKYGYRKSPQYAGFEAYMDAPFSELPKDDMGRDDPRRMCFIDDMGVPEELLFMLWQASRRAALEEAWAICNANAAKLKGPKETASGYVALVLTADDIRALAKETNNG